MSHASWEHFGRQEACSRYVHSSSSDTTSYQVFRYVIDTRVTLIQRFNVIWILRKTVQCSSNLKIKLNFIWRIKNEKILTQSKLKLGQIKIIRIVWYQLYLINDQFILIPDMKIREHTTPEKDQTVHVSPTSSPCRNFSNFFLKRQDQ